MVTCRCAAVCDWGRWLLLPAQWAVALTTCKQSLLRALCICTFVYVHMFTVQADVNGGISAARMQAAAATALSSAAVKAKMLAQQEEREIQRLMLDLIDLQVLAECKTYP